MQAIYNLFNSTIFRDELLIETFLLKVCCYRGIRTASWLYIGNNKIVISCFFFFSFEQSVRWCSSFTTHKNFLL